MADARHAMGRPDEPHLPPAASRRETIPAAENAFCRALARLASAMEASSNALPLPVRLAATTTAAAATECQRVPQICPSVLLCGAVQDSPSPQRAADCAVKGPKSSIDLGLVERFAVTLMSRGKGMLLGWV